MELKISELVIPNEITFNYDELKAELTDKVKTYKAIVYGDSEIKEAKADKANLNKLKKALNDERIRLEREYMTPFNTFKAQITEIIGIIDEPIAVIDSQVKAYEDKVKAEKQAEIEAYYDSIEDKPDWLLLSQIWDDKWLNVSVNMKTIKETIQGHIDRVSTELGTLGSLTEFSFEAVEEYKRTLDVNKAIAEGKRLADIQRRKAEAEAAAKIEAEKTPKPTPVPAPVAQTAERPADDNYMWVSFKAYITAEQAAALKDFFKSNNIQFEAI